MTKKQDERMETLEEFQAKIIQSEKDATLAALLYITRKLGELEGVISTQSAPDNRLVTAKDDLLRQYYRLIEKVGLRESMELQEQELEKNDDEYY